MKSATTVAATAKRGDKSTRRAAAGPLSPAELDHLVYLLQRCARSKQVTLCTARRDAPEVIGTMVGGVDFSCAAVVVDGDVDARHELELCVPFDTSASLSHSAPADPHSERAQ